MQRSSSMVLSKTLPANRILRPVTRFPSPNPNPNPHDVFINHRGTDTKRTVAGLLFQHLSGLGLDPFLDCKTMRPGDKLFDSIHGAIRNCRLGLAVFSKGYCESYFCLHELALMMECNKRVVPVFCDVKPSELRVKEDSARWSRKEVKRFQRAIEEAKQTVGLTFDTSTGDWSQFLTSATDVVIQRLLEVEENQHYFLGRNLIKHGHAKFAQRRKFTNSS